MILDDRAECPRTRPDLPKVSLTAASLLSLLSRRGKAADHIERHDIAERDFACLVTLHKDAIDNLWTASGGQSQYKWLFRCRIEGIDSACVETN